MLNYLFLGVWGIVMLVSLKRPVVGLSMFIILTLSNLMQIFPAIGDFHLAMVTPALIFLIYAMRKESSAMVKTPLPVILIGFVVAVVLSALVSGSFREGLTPIIVVVKNVGVCVLMMIFVRRWIEVRWILWATCAGAMVNSVACVAGALSVGGIGVAEATGLMTDSNYLALNIVPAMPLAIFFALQGKRYSRLFWWGVLVLMSVATVATYSRSGFVTALVTMAAVMWPYRRRAKTYMILLVVAVAAAVIVPQSYHKKVASIFAKEEERDRSMRGRMRLSLAGLDIFANHPVLGVGPGNFGEAMKPYFVKASLFEVRLKHSAAHNHYVEVAAETGVLGIGLFMTVVVASIAGVKRLRRLAHETENDFVFVLAGALLCTLISLFTGIAFLSAEGSKMLWIGLALPVCAGNAFVNWRQASGVAENRNDRGFAQETSLANAASERVAVS